MPEEIELKLRLNLADVPRLKRSQAIRKFLLGKPRTRKLTSIYYDTPDLELMHAAVSLRVRHMSGKWYQSVKTAGMADAGLHSRLEWEDILKQGKPDFEKICSIDAADIVSLFSDPALQAKLSPIFSTAVKRTEWQLNIDQSNLELALDIGHVVISGEEVATICELEIELKSGNPEDIQVFAALLKRQFPLREENVSKAQLGYKFYRQLHKN